MRRLEVEVANAVSAPVAPAFVRRVLQRAAEQPEVLARMPTTVATLAVRLTGDAELRRLHRSYAGIDSITDVLSFTGESGHLGDIAISWPAVQRQSKRFGHSEKSELALLCVHGMLHVLGWDHATAVQRREMARVTTVALQRSGIELAAGRL
jgi:rRNA maturation RNase YbeY